MMGEAVRAVMFGLIICLHVNYRPDDRSSQPTLAKLKRTLQAYGLTSPRRVEALISRLVQVGYLRTEAAPGHRPAPLLVPCPPFILPHPHFLSLLFAPPFCISFCWVTFFFFFLFSFFSFFFFFYFFFFFFFFFFL